MKQEKYLFYDSDQIYCSAKIICEEIRKFLPEINSLADIGCGMAAFAKAFQEEGVEKIILIDHPSLDISKCLVKENFEFIPCDLDNDLPKPIRVDLAICTEVLEHLNKERSLKILDYITQCADIIIFSAAVPRQGGRGHVNEQRHKFWISEFEKRKFDYSDSFKSNISKNEGVLYWLTQNLFIFFKNKNENSLLFNTKLFGNNFEILNQCILNKEFGFFELLRMLPRAFYHSLLKRLTSK
jgi:hypothetical protein